MLIYIYIYIFAGGLIGSLAQVIYIYTHIYISRTTQTVSQPMKVLYISLREVLLKEYRKKGLS